MTGLLDGVISDSQCPDTFLVYRPGSGNSVEILDIAAGVRREGRGRRMVGELVNLCASSGVTRIYAITRAENFIAQEFYEALNFKSIPLRNFYGQRTKDDLKTVDAIMYLRDLEHYP